MEIEVERTADGYHLARCVGELRSEHGPLLQEQLHPLIAESAAALILDISKLKWLDSSGLSHLISLVTHARLSKSRVIIAGATAFVAGVLEMTALDRWFEMARDVPEAERRLGLPAV